MRTIDEIVSGYKLASLVASLGAIKHMHGGPWLKLVGEVCSKDFRLSQLNENLRCIVNFSELEASEQTKHNRSSKRELEILLRGPLDEYVAGKIATERNHNQSRAEIQTVVANQLPGDQPTLQSQFELTTND